MLKIGLSLFPQLRSLWNPSELFPNAEKGFWAGGYDPASERLWQATNSASLATAPGHPVGASLSAHLADRLGDELIVNGDFSSDLWRWGKSTESTITDGVARIKSTTVSYPFVARTIAIESGKSYLISVDVLDVTSGQLRVLFSGGSAVTLLGGVGRRYAILTGHRTGSVNLYFDTATGISDVTIDNASCREIVTPTAKQATSLARPTLARWPKGGRRNLLTQTETYTNNPWHIFNGSVSKTTSLALENDSINMWEFTTGSATLPTATSVGIIWPAVANSGFTLSCYVKPGSNRYIYFSSNSGGSQTNVGAKYKYDTSTGTATSVYSGHVTYHKAHVDDLGGGVYRVVLSVQQVTNAGNKVFAVYCSDYNEPYLPSTVIQINESQIGPFSVGGWQCEVCDDVEADPDPTPYQKVTTAYDVSEEGVESLWHLYDDGGDSLPVVLPAGDYGVAYVDHLGEVTFGTVTSDGVTPIDTLLEARQLDVIFREGDFRDGEKALIETYWQRMYAA